MKTIKLRGFQDKLIADTRQSLARGNNRVIIQSHVGSGKTIVATEITKRAIEKMARVLFLAPRRQLIYQTVETFREYGINCGVIMAGELRNSQPLVQVASFDTITSRVGAGRMDLPLADLCIVDEVHMCTSPARIKILENYKRVIGLTATPALANGKGMGFFYQDIVESLTMKQMVDQGYLVPMRYYIGESPDLSGVKLNSDGDFVEKQLAEVNDKPKLIGAIFENWQRIAGDRTTLVFAVNRLHARHLHDEFVGHGINAEYIDGETPPDEREQIRQNVEAGKTQVVINIGVMVAGVNWPRISCIVIARQMRNIANWIQCIGRGSRLHPTKSDCIARDTMILTDKGLVKIQDITLYHKLWDGVSWVSHGGAICKGVQTTIEYGGLIATPDHRVMTNEGWKKFSEAADRRLRIVKSGFGWLAVRVSENNFTENRREKRSANGGGGLFAMWERVHDFLSQYTQKGKSKAMSYMQSKEQDKSAFVDLQKVPGANGQVYKPEKSGIRKIWSERHRISFRVCKFRSSLDSGKSWNTKQHGISTGQNRQQHTLRAWEFEVVNTSSEPEQHTLFGWVKKTAIHSVQRVISTYQICRLNIKQAYSYWSNRWPDNRQVQLSFAQTEREVWDILNAGSLQRFTANGNLVHNCLVIYHGSNFDELGMIDDPIQWSLDDKSTIRERKEKEKQEAKEPKEITCTECGTVFKSRRQCPNCGHEMIKHGEPMPHHEAELVEVKVTPRDKSQWYAELLGYARRHGKSDKFALAIFRNKFNEWPYNKRSITPVEPGDEVIKYVRHNQIKFAKR